MSRHSSDPVLMGCSIITNRTIRGHDNPEAQARRHQHCRKSVYPFSMFHGLKDKALHSDGLNNTWDWLEKDLTLVTVPGAGHFVQQDASELVTTTMQWWIGR